MARAAQTRPCARPEASVESDEYLQRPSNVTPAALYSCLNQVAISVNGHAEYRAGAAAGGAGTTAGGAGTDTPSNRVTGSRVIARVGAMFLKYRAAGS